jgi:hypothetical protein
MIENVSKQKYHMPYKEKLVCAAMEPIIIKYLLFNLEGTMNENFNMLHIIFFVIK